VDSWVREEFCQAGGKTRQDKKRFSGLFLGKKNKATENTRKKTKENDENSPRKLNKQNLHFITS
jgi:hypothetical protein